MSETEIKKNQKSSILKELLSRRILQIIGIYIGISWGVVQFVDWLVNRYLWSTHLTDLAIVILLSFIPTAAIIAYFHGKPGRNRWTKTEKIWIPLNFIFAIVLLFLVFSEKDLGSVIKTLTLEDETGKKIQKIIPKNEFRKRIAIFNFKNESGNARLDWLQDGITASLHYDLLQDLFIDSQGSLTSTYIFKEMEKSGFPNRVDLPLTLQRQIARELHLDYFLTGTFTRSGDQYLIKCSLYETKRGKLLTENRFEGDSIFKLVDSITVKLKQDLKLPSQHIEGTDDLPVAELLTTSLEALEYCIKGSNQMVYKNNFKVSAKLLNQAVKIDPSFAAAHYQRGIIYANLNQAADSNKALDMAMKYLYKLPDKLKVQVKSIFYIMKNEATKVFKLAKMQVELYPQDIDARLGLANIYHRQNQLTDAIEEYQKVIEIAPDPYVYYHDIGQLFMKKGDAKETLRYYNTYAEQFPKSTLSFKKLGTYYEVMGDYPQAKVNYDKALLLDSGNISIILDVGDVENKLGNFQQALNQYQSALKQSKIPQDKSTVYNRLENYYRSRGQVTKALEYVLLKQKENEKFQPPFGMLLLKLLDIPSFVKAGQKETALQQIKAIENQLKPPFDQIMAFGYAALYVELKDIVNAEKMTAEIDNVIKTFGVTLSGAHSFKYSFQGEIHELKKEYGKAIQSYMKYVEINPVDAKININIGRCYRHLKEFEDAENYIQKCLKIYPFSPEAQYELAIIYLEIGKQEDALKHLKTALDVWKDADPIHEPAKKAREKYQQQQLKAQLK